MIVSVPKFANRAKWEDPTGGSPAHPRRSRTRGARILSDGPRYCNPPVILGSTRFGAGRRPGFVRRPAAPRFLLGDPACAEPTVELILHVGPGNVVVAEQDQGVEDQVGHLVDQMGATFRARFRGGGDDLARL